MVWNSNRYSDVIGEHPAVDFYLYDLSEQETFLGHVNVVPNLNDHDSTIEQWFKLEARHAADENITGEIFLRLNYRKTEKKVYGPADFEILKLIGKGKHP